MARAWIPHWNNHSRRHDVFSPQGASEDHLLGRAHHVHGDGDPRDSQARYVERSPNKLGMEWF